MANNLRIKGVDGGYRIIGDDASGTTVVADWTTYATREEAEIAMGVLADNLANEQHEYLYQTDSEGGYLTACDFGAACRKLDDMLTEAAIENGAWGWVEDVDGERYAIGSR